MRKEEKLTVIDDLTELLSNSKHFYLTDSSDLDAIATYELRKACFEKDIKLVMVKNTLLKRALDKLDGEYDELHQTLKGSTSIMLCDTGNAPAKLIKDFRKSHDKPLLKGAFVEEAIYLGEEELENLVSVKSKEELLGDVIGLLQSPIQQVVSSLQSGGNTLAGLVKTLSEKE
ncbi:LSU ribosomal protein L10P [Balneicella halophila]|uniref:Large ribosomal subunit protein uL10 n=1 Tax=Balneicella halophila TaxID=1537566 RepID=A0A7L4UP21_BALHA|nr:50S ribosomal protein L10 [Balneicella halophila]PVX50930.1 LSU ribosomal protein L10P [Balneicella halophila]